MKASEAAVKGRELVEPRQGNDLFQPDEDGGKYGGCYRGMLVVGAEAVKLPPDGEDGSFDLSTQLTDTWPWLLKELPYPCTCPATNRAMVGVGGQPIKMTVAHLLAHLWDAHVTCGDLGAQPHTEQLDDPWTFERITNWLRSIEPAA